MTNQFLFLMWQVGQYITTLHLYRLFLTLFSRMSLVCPFWMAICPSWSSSIKTGFMLQKFERHSPKMEKHMKGYWGRLNQGLIILRLSGQSWPHFSLCISFKGWSSWFYYFYFWHRCVNYQLSETLDHHKLKDFP